jgi:hypothetical protein
MLLAVLVGLFLCTTSAEAATRVVRPNGQPSHYFQRLVKRSHAPTPPIVVTVKVGPCPVDDEWTDGCMLGPYIWVEKGAGHPVFWHEMGHVFDRWQLWRRGLADDASGVRTRLRDRFSRIVGYSRLAWWAGADWDESGYEGPTPAETFADEYSVCAMFRPRNYRYGQGAFGNFFVSVQALRKTCRLIRKTAKS